MLAGLIQFPSKKSLSNIVFNKYFKRLNKEIFHEDISIPPELFDNYIPDILKKYTYLNVTIPFKTKILNYINISNEAHNLNAVNCIYKNCGYNTDYLGIINSLKNVVIDSPILILGAGGVAKAFLYALTNLKIKKVFVSNRTLKNAIDLKKRFDSFLDIEIIPYENIQKYLSNFKTFINCTSIGMCGENFDFELNLINNVSLIYDSVYSKTLLQTFAYNNNISIINGEKLWYYQAIENLKIWNLYNEEIFEISYNERFEK